MSHILPGMSDSKEKKSAFAVLTAASRRASTPLQGDKAKKRKLSGPSESSFGTCPICGCKLAVALLNSHVNACLETGNTVEGAEVEKLPSLGSHCTDRGGPKLECLAGERGPITKEASGQCFDKPRADSPHQKSVDLPGAPRPESDAFARLMQQQRQQSMVHNFYLERKPDGSWWWHWFLTTPRQDARLSADLPGPQAMKAQRHPDFSKGAVDPTLRKVYGGPGDSAGAHTRPAALQQPVSGRALEMQHPTQRAQTTVMSNALQCQSQPGAADDQVFRSNAIGGTAGDTEGSNADTEWWLKLPPAVWHMMTHLPASKLGGSANVKLNIRLLTNVPSGEDEINWNTRGLQSNISHGASGFRGSNSLLKSALQKNVRLKRPASAVRCALHLIKEDASEFLRRCSIICVEDAVLHPALPLIVWLMAAHAKGYVPGRQQVGRCLAIVHHLADCPSKDSCSQAGGRRGASPLELFEKVKSLAGEHAVLVRCILMRAAYGGMAGDVELLKDAAETWAERFVNVGPTPPEVPHQPLPDNASAWAEYIWFLARKSQATVEDPVALFTVNGVGPLQQSDIPPSAVDFHVSSIVEELLQKPEIMAAAQRCGRDAAGVFQKAIWRFRSSLSNKSALSPKQCATDSATPAALPQLQAFWDIVEPHVEAWANNFISRKFYT